jgi:hypothetical protein
LIVGPRLKSSPYWYGLKILASGGDDTTTAASGPADAVADPGAGARTDAGAVLLPHAATTAKLTIAALIRA